MTGPRDDDQDDAAELARLIDEADAAAVTAIMAMTDDYRRSPPGEAA